MTCAEVMTPSPTVALPQHTVTDAAELMRREDCGLVPVVSETNKLIGVLSDRDIVLKVVAEGRDPRSVAVTDVMSTDLVTCLPQETIETAMEQMATRQVRRIPIVDRDGSLVGIVSQADLATRLSSPQETGQVVQAISEESV